MAIVSLRKGTSCVFTKGLVMTNKTQTSDSFFLLRASRHQRQGVHLQGALEASEVGPQHRSGGVIQEVSCTDPWFYR